MGDQRRGSKSPMSIAGEQTAKVRDYARIWVDREERSIGSRMAAYKRVASAVGASSDWLRKFIAGNEAKQPRWDIGHNIIEQYERICARIEANNEMRRTWIEMLRQKVVTNAPHQSALEMGKADGMGMEDGVDDPSSSSKSISQAVGE